MFSKYSYLICYLCWIISITGVPTDKDLKFQLVQVLFRHGARAPIECEMRMLNTSRSLYDPWGPAQLTNEGMMQEYKIGQMLRERYEGFIPRAYKLEHVYAYASGVSRTKASLELLLAALYPPDKGLAWNSELNWMPIPIHSSPRPMDILVKPRDCPKYIEALQELFNTTEIKEAAAKHEPVLKKMRKIFGANFDLNEVFCLYNAIFVHKNMNLSLPAWYTDEIYAELKKAGEFYIDALSYNTVLKRLNGGTLARKFVENMNNSILKKNERKIYLYSTHDKTLHAVAKSHNLILPRTPDYGSAIILETLRDQLDNEFYTRILFWSGEPKVLRTLKLEDCTEICPLNEYLKIINPILPSNDEMRCLLKNLQPEKIEQILNTDTTAIED